MRCSSGVRTYYFTHILHTRYMGLELRPHARPFQKPRTGVFRGFCRIFEAVVKGVSLGVGERGGLSQVLLGCPQSSEEMPSWGVEEGWWCTVCCVGEGGVGWTVWCKGGGFLVPLVTPGTA